MDLVCSVVKLKLRATDTTVGAHWSVNTRETQFLAACFSAIYLIRPPVCLCLLDLLCVEISVSAWDLLGTAGWVLVNEPG